MLVSRNVGLGAQEVLRTAAQAAADLEQFGAGAGYMATQGGLTNMASVFKYATSQGRLQDLQNEVIRIEGILTTLAGEMEVIAKELDELGVPNVMSMVKMGISMAAMIGNYFLPGIGPLVSAFGIGDKFFGGSNKKKQRAESLMIRLQEKMERFAFWDARKNALVNEGQNLAQAFEQGERAITAKLAPTVTVQDVSRKYTSDARDYYHLEYKQRQIADVNLATQDELKSRLANVQSQTGATALAVGTPVGFQTIYSRALESPIVAKVPTAVVPPRAIAGKQVVYGGLAGEPEWYAYIDWKMAVCAGLIAYLLIRE